MSLMSIEEIIEGVNKMTDKEKMDWLQFMRICDRWQHTCTGELISRGINYEKSYWAAGLKHFVDMSEPESVQLYINNVDERASDKYKKLVDWENKKHVLQKKKAV